MAEGETRGDDDLAEWTKTDPATGVVTVRLQYPVRVGERTVTEMSLRRPKGKDMIAMEQNAAGEMAQSIGLINRLLPDDMAVAEELDGVDIKRMSRVVAGFLQVSLPTGATS